MQSITNDIGFSDKEQLSDFKTNLSSLNGVIQQLKNSKLERRYAKITSSISKGDKLYHILENSHSKLTDVLLLTHIQDLAIKNDLNSSLIKNKALNIMYETEKLLVKSIVSQNR